MQELNKALAAQIYDTISSELSEPIVVSRTMSHDRFLISILENEASRSNEETTDLMADYLSGLREGLDYESAFVISDYSHIYYSYNGLGKTLDLENDYHDQWYPAFLSQNIPYNVDVDRDELNANAWTVFVNARIESDNGTLLGVCGVGVHMKKSQALFHELENAYQVKINLIDTDGLIQVDTNESLIENTVLSDVKLIKNEEYNYERQGWNGFSISKYIDRLGWFLVIRSDGSTQTNQFIHMLVLNIGLCLLMMSILFVSIRIIADRTKALAHASFRDQTTGLLNRMAFEEEKARLMDASPDENFVYVTADLNGLKTANDTLGHAAGDELIKGAADCLNACFGSHGSVYRIGGDEFAAMLTVTPEQLEDILRNFDEMTSAWSGKTVSGLSVSLGYTSRKEFPSENISEIMQISDERMYAAKEKYYKESGKTRRG